MSSLPRVAESTRERVAREFDDIGPEAFMAEIIEDLRHNNPEVLDIASRCASSLGVHSKIMRGFGIFYRLLVAQAAADARGIPSSLPRVTPETRDSIVGQIDAKGERVFTMEIIEDLERDNPELLQMAHNFADGQDNYLAIMQGFALVYKSLVDQSVADRIRLH